MPKVDKFNGIVCPNTYLKMYVKSLQPVGESEYLMAQLFKQTFTGTTLRWFLSLEDNKTQTQEEICVVSNRQYRYHIKADDTKKDLETIKQQPNKIFSTFIIRWRAKASQMTKHPNKEGRIQILVKNLLLFYLYHLFISYFPNSMYFIRAGTQIKDAIANCQIKKKKSKFRRVENS